MSNRHTQTGFTLVEMIVAVAVFSVVATVSVGALLMLIGTNEQLQSEQSVMTNLSFALDSMTREIRTGTWYYCEYSQNNDNNTIFYDGVSFDLDEYMAGVHNDPGPGPDIWNEEDVDDCSSGANNNNPQRYLGVAFKESGNSITGNSGAVLYYYDRDYYGTDMGQIFRRVGTRDIEPILSDNIVVTDAEFYVTGSEPLSAGGGEIVQPTVTIFIEAIEADRFGVSGEDPYRLQTTVTQRTLDI